MTVSTGAGAHSAPEPFDPFLSDHDSQRSDDTSADSYTPDELPTDAPVDPGAIAGDASGVRKKRRRGSRGGRRRREKRDAQRDGLPHDEALGPAPDDESGPVAQDFVPADEIEPGDDGIGDPLRAGLDSGPANAGQKKRRRGRRRGRGQASGDLAGAPAAARTPRVATPRPSTRSSTSSGAVPRELDAFGDEDGGESEEVHGEPVRASPGPRAPASRAALPDAGDVKRRRRGSRGGRRRKKHTGGELPRDVPVEIEAIPGEDDDLPLRAAARAAVAATVDDAAPARARRKRGEKIKPAVDVDQDEGSVHAIPESQRTSLILVNATDPEEQRVAVVDDGQIVDFQMTVKDQDSLVNDIYRGRVVNLEPAIGAAFIDFGEGRNGFLHTSDVLSMYGDKDWSLDKLMSAEIDPEEWDAGGDQPSDAKDSSDDEEGEEKSKKPGRGRSARGTRTAGRQRFRARPRLPITDLLKKGQMVVVQVTKDAIGDKGPTLTTYISIPGRYLVLMPSMSRTGVSRKIEDEKERKRLKRILTSLEVPQNMGVIVRTAGVGHSKDEIRRDLDYLKGAWEAFGKKLAHGNAPAPLYRESDVAIRTMRDLFTPTTKAVYVDDFEVHRHLVEFTEKLMPEDVARIHHHEGPRPLFQTHGIEPDFEKIFARRIELPSGGSIVFDQAEALVAIDVNSGRTRSDGFDFEEIALKTNIEAAPEIARQIRLRDLGGILVLDFIDMMKLANIRAVEKSFKEALSTDRARSKLGRISQFGLLEMTRQRLGPGMSKKVFHTCPRCRGTGRIRTVNSRAAAILRRLGAAMTLKGFQTVEVRAHPEVVAYLKRDCSELLRALEYRFQREVRLIDVTDQAEDSVLRYLRTDGREVRPGGRRKR